MLFEKLTNDLFAVVKYSRNELDLFTVDHLARLSKMSDPVLPTSEVVATQELHMAFKEHLGHLTTHQGARQGGTITRQDAFDEVLEFIRRKEGALRSEFGKGTAAYVEFYPAGILEYSQATVEGIKDLLVRYVAVSEKYRAKLGDKFVEDIKALQVLYTQAREEQSGNMAVHKTAQTLLRDARKALTLQLTRNVLLIAAHTLEDREAFNAYFGFGYLYVDDPNPRLPKD